MEKYLLYIDCSNFILYLNLIMILSFNPCWIARAFCIPPVFAHLLLLTFRPLLPLLFSLQVMTARHLHVEHLETNLFSLCTYMWRIQWMESNMDHFAWHLGGETITGPSSGLSCLYMPSFRTLPWLLSYSHENPSASEEIASSSSS